MIPSVNPDGGERRTRPNAAGTDLNRDHLLLEQPETRALHRIAREIQPHIVVDCHEFTRDGEGYSARGWRRWPIITMDTANHLFLPDAVYEVGLAWVEAAREPLAAAGIAYERYGGRLITRRTPTAARTFPAGSLLVPVEQVLAVRVLQLLEPNLLYGLYERDGFRQAVAWDGTLPVWRISQLPTQLRRSSPSSSKDSRP